MNGIERKFREIGRMRGRGSEHLVCAALEVMVQKKEIDQFERIEPYSDLDYKGIDFLVTIKGQKFPLQVKSSRYGSKKAREEHFRISVVRARPGDPIETVHQRLKSELGRAKKRYLRESRWEI